MFLLKRKNKESTKPKKKPTLFGHDTGSDSDTEDRFLLSVRSKEAKVNSQVSKCAESETDYVAKDTHDGSGYREKSPATTLKYIGGLKDAANQRKKTFEAARQQLRDQSVRSFDGMVFESSEYKQIRREKTVDRQDNESDEESDSKGNDKLFYNRILDARMGSSLVQPNIPSKKLISEKLDKIIEQAAANTAAASAAEQQQDMEITSPAHHLGTSFDHKLASLLKSKVTPDSLKLYRKRYWERQNLAAS